MALKLGKCRLCLKLGDFCSIFTLDNNVPLAAMVMECARVKICDGDGLPDKICNECIQKLSGAHIFKQQCERSDQELRRNYVPPPGFCVTTPTTYRPSSDSAFSTHTETSKPSSSFDSKVTPVLRTRKRSHDSEDNASNSSRSHDYRHGVSKRVDELRGGGQKKGKYNETNSDSDYEDHIGSFYSAETDSDDVLDFKCKICHKAFKSVKSLSAHTKVHKRRINQNISVRSEEADINNSISDSIDRDTNELNTSRNTPEALQDANDIENKLSCARCNRTFKLKIMLKRHSEVCDKSPQKTLRVAIENLDGLGLSPKIQCELCSLTFKTSDDMEKHVNVIHADIKRTVVDDKPRILAPCYYCGLQFDQYDAHRNHLKVCPQATGTLIFECPLCNKVISRKNNYSLHLKSHYFPSPSTKFPDSISSPQSYPCRHCNEVVATKELLISHLSKHLSNVDNEGADEQSRPSTLDDSMSAQSGFSSSAKSGSVNCQYCGKGFTYRKALMTHIEKLHAGKNDGSDDDGNYGNDFESMEQSTGLLSVSNQTMNASEATDSDSSQDEGEDDNTCDICEKQFSYRRLLLHHKRTKHCMTSGTKRAKVNLKDCSVRCLICDIEMKVSDINEHNQTHIAVNIKPRNLYTCTLCTSTFKSCSSLASHIKLVHRLKQQPAQKIEMATPDLADFCQVVVTKAEPLDDFQGHNGLNEASAQEIQIPILNLNGLTCPICGKQLPTLISLKRHVNWHKNVGNNIEKLLKCFVCKETFRFQRHFKLHMREHYQDTNLDPKHLTCGICNRKSKHLRAAQAHLNYHKQTRFQNKDYECSICKRVFQFRKIYLSHMAIHFKRGDSSNNTIVGCDLPTTADKNVFDGKHTCHLCGKVCDSESSLKHHLIWHKSKSVLYGARHECNICNLVFTNKRRLELHTRAHFEDDNGPFKCHICGKGYTDEEFFKRHVKGHNFDHQSHKKRVENLRKNKVKCPICSRYYPDVVKLIRHLRRTHPESKMIKEDPDAPPPIYYSCKLCAKDFLDERRLRSHEESHLRKPEFFKCKFCGKSNISLKNHRVHIKGHLTQKYIDKPLDCPQCEEKFQRGYDLHYHLRDVHSVNETWIAERGTQMLDGPLKKLQCPTCFKILANKGNYGRHIDYHNSLRCNYCFEDFNTFRFLEGHLAFSCEKKKLLGDTEIYSKKVKCKLCYKPFHLQVKLDCHMRTQHQIKVFKEATVSKKEIVCDYCFKVFENEDALSGHKVYHRTVGYYGCKYCNRKFNTITSYKKHKNHHLSQLNVDKPNKCHHCEETFVAFREMIYHMRDVHGDVSEWIVLPKESIEEKCSICDKTFFNIRRHLDYHEENRCKKCGEYFYSNIDHDNHLCAIDSEDDTTENTTVTDIRPKYEECAFCFKPITKKNSFRVHDHLHKTSGSISCRFCTLKFKTIDAFNIHSFTHRNRKYKQKPIKCRKCGEQFVKYGPFIKHMKHVHKCNKKLHYRTTVKPEPCAVCGDEFPNLHNHYRAHLQNQCQQCLKYFTSSRLYSLHVCGEEDSDPSKVFTCDADLLRLINEYVPQDENDDEKFYGYDNDQDFEVANDIPKSATNVTQEQVSLTTNGEPIDIDEENLHEMVHAPIISDVLSLYEKKDVKKDNMDPDVVLLTDDDLSNGPVVVIED